MHGRLCITRVDGAANSLFSYIFLPISFLFDSNSFVCRLWTSQTGAVCVVSHRNGCTRTCHTENGRKKNGDAAERIELKLKTNGELYMLRLDVRQVKCSTFVYGRRGAHRLLLTSFKLTICRALSDGDVLNSIGHPISVSQQRNAHDVQRTATVCIGIGTKP